MSDARIEVIRNRIRAATPGPWKWRWAVGGLPELFAPKFLLVMDAVRHGMNSAVVRFAHRPDPRDRGGLMVKATKLLQSPGRKIPDCQEPANPDMAFISHAREDVEYLLANVERLLNDCNGMAINGAYEYLSGERDRLQREADAARVTAEHLHEKVTELELKLAARCNREKTE